MSGTLRRRLAGTPRLLAAYLAWGNAGRSRTLGLALAVLVAWAFWVALAPSALIDWLRHGPVLLAVVAAVVALILVSRRRALSRDAARRSWTAALPVAPHAARWQALVLETAPVWHLAAGVTLLCTGPRGLLPSWGAMMGGAAAGTMAGLVMPSPRPELLPEGSRYVPHRRRAEQTLPRGSLAALGAWPVRQMFASARPQAVARATVPVLLLMPMGSRADAALVVLGGAAVIGALGLLTNALASVSQAGLRWLQPLPAEPGALLRRIAAPAAWVIVVGAGLDAWLPSLMGASARLCLRIGVATLVVGEIAALAALWLGRQRSMRESR